MITFRFVTSSGSKYDGEVYEVIVPTRAGTVSIFEDHMPMISAAQPGVVSVRKKLGDADSEMEHFAISGGVVEASGKTISFVADDITAADDINEKEAEAAHTRAEELVKNADSQTQLQEARRSLQHSSAQLHVARLKRRHH